MFAERIKSHNTASHLQRVWLLYELSKVAKAATFVPTLERSRLRHKWGQDSAHRGCRSSTPGASRLSCSHPSVTPVPTVFADICQGHTLYRASTQLSADLQFRPITSTRTHSYEGRSLEIRDSWFLWAPVLQIKCQNSGSTPHSITPLHLGAFLPRLYGRSKFPSCRGFKVSAEEVWKQFLRNWTKPSVANHLQSFKGLFSSI